MFKEDELYPKEKKLEWFGPGEWVDEADHIIFEYEGYKCKIIRIIKREPYCSEEVMFGGHLCGYVYPKEEDDRDFCESLHCHGGITYNGCDENHCNMIGFDCSHSMDVVPSMISTRKKIDVEFMEKFKDYSKVCEGYEKLFSSSYKNISFCISQCKHMVDQLISVRRENAPVEK